MSGPGSRQTLSSKLSKRMKLSALTQSREMEVGKVDIPANKPKDICVEPKIAEELQMVTTSGDGDSQQKGKRHLEGSKESTDSEDKGDAGEKEDEEEKREEDEEGEYFENSVGKKFRLNISDEASILQVMMSQSYYHNICCPKYRTTSRLENTFLKKVNVVHAEEIFVLFLTGTRVRERHGSKSS